MRNLLEEFLIKHGKSEPTILGVREHIFTGRFGFSFFLLITSRLQRAINFADSVFIFLTPFVLTLCCSYLTYSVSSLAWFMSNQETSFVTIGQRVLANTLKYVSFHLQNYIGQFILYNFCNIVTILHNLNVCLIHIPFMLLASPQAFSMVLSKL